MQSGTRLGAIAIASRIATALAIAAHLSAQAQVNDDTTVIEAGKLSITKADFEKMLANDPRLPVALARPEAKQSLGLEFGKAFALEAEALRQGLDRDPAVQLRLRAYQQQVLANELLVSMRKGFLRDEARLAAEYEQHRDFYAQPRVRHVLVRMQGSPVALRPGRPDLSPAVAKAKAEALRARLDAGADFAGLARAESDDAGSAASGGDIGFVTKGSTAAAFEAAAYALPVGAVSAVVKTEYGYHVLRVEAREPMPLAAAKSMVANALAHAELDRIIANGYTLNAAYFGR
jgi:peptidyl-prolyl cis-trans isomerase C